MLLGEMVFVVNLVLMFTCSLELEFSIRYTSLYTSIIGFLISVIMLIFWLSGNLLSNVRLKAVGVVRACLLIFQGLLTVGLLYPAHDHHGGVIGWYLELQGYPFLYIVPGVKGVFFRS
jgi:hypothetical protein